MTIKTPRLDKYLDNLSRELEGLYNVTGSEDIRLSREQKDIIKEKMVEYALDAVHDSRVCDEAFAYSADINE